MTVTAVHSDPDGLTLTLQAEFDASVERVWQLWADPRQLERWWGPPGYPATMTTHDLRPGGRVEYHMSGPEGDRFHGYWDVEEVDPPRGLVIRDGFAHPDGRPNDDMPRNTVQLVISDLAEGRTRMIIQTSFPDLASMEQILAMGMEEGLTAAVGQIDAILAADATTVAARHLEVPGARIVWDLQPADTSDQPVLVMVGYPMGAAGFASQVGRFTDRTTITFDPRGIERSSGGPTDQPLVEQNVADLHALLDVIRDQLGERPIDVFASSGGAVTALELLARHPNDVATLIAHEPPTLAVLEDAEAAGAAWLAVHDTYQRHGWATGMAHFIAMTMHEGPFDAEWASRPAPDPATFGMPAEDDGSRNDPLLSQDQTGVPHHVLDFAAIAAAPTRVVIGVGAETGDTLTGRTSTQVAAALGADLVVFPGGHNGFMGGEYGQPPGEPDGFAATLRHHLDRPARR
ncbi:alpha/beta fold hydrolase [Euzebya tangerina]|uniref:alpha/beta fold hydrolase n=1 Tax=Euzebya tangerina TaxID=591198 RepID=UPI00196A943E|nr:alpha/beta fold hydrolase [Euzebya tangerina]